MKISSELGINENWAQNARLTAQGDPSEKDSVSFREPAAQSLGNVSIHGAINRIVDAFAPANPVVNSQYFVGRTKQLSQLIDAIEEHRNHLLVTGPRGCGKTSLALTLLSSARKAKYTPLYVSCSRGSTFPSIFHSVLAGLSRRFDSNSDPSSEAAKSSFLDLLSSEEINAQTVGELLSRVTGTRVLVVLDEFDLPEDDKVRSDLVELMKTLSDHAAPVHLMLIGNASSLDDLLGSQSSMPRSLFKMTLAHMSDDEIRYVLSKLANIVGIQVSPDAMNEVIAFAQGRLFIAKMLFLRAAKLVTIKSAALMTIGDFEAALEGLREHFNSDGLSALEKVVSKNPSLRFIFDAIIRSVRENGDRFTVEQVFGYCKNVPVMQRFEAQRIELILNSLTESRSVLARSSRNDKQLFQFVDPNIELAFAIVSYRARSLAKDDLKLAELVPDRHLTSNHS